MPAVKPDQYIPDPFEGIPRSQAELERLLSGNARIMSPLNRILRSSEFEKAKMRERRDIVAGNIDRLLSYWPVVTPYVESIPPISAAGEPTNSTLAETA